MKPTEVAESLQLLVNKKRPAFIWGPPGVGKSDVVLQAADHLGIECRDVRLNLLDAVDLKGFPMPDLKKRQMITLPPDFLPTEGEGILFFDEMNSAAQSVQAAAYSLILNRRIGNYHLPPGWAMIAAGNREGDRSVVNRMPAALANRFVHLDFEVNVEDWARWALNNGVQSDLLAFIRFRTNLLHDFDPAKKAFPSPRSWMFVNELMHSALDPSIEFELFKGTVGEGAAAEFAAFLGVVRDLPTIDDILLHPDRATVPEQPSSLYALTTSLGMKAKLANNDRLMTYIKRLPIEFQVVYIRDSTLGDPTITRSKAFLDWATTHSDVLV